MDLKTPYSHAFSLVFYLNEMISAKKVRMKSKVDIIMLNIPIPLLTLSNYCSIVSLSRTITLSFEENC
jgi:hypothetical protein